MCCAKAPGNFEPVCVARQSDHHNVFCAGSFRGNHTAAALLSRTKDHERLAGSDAGIEKRPLKAIAQRQGHRRDMWWNMGGQAVKYGSWMQIEKLTVSAVKTRRDIQFCRAVADAIRVEVIGLEAGAILAIAAIFAVAAREIFLQRDIVAFFDAPTRLCNRSKLLDISDDLMAKNTGDKFVAGVFAPVAAAYPACDNAQQPGVRTDFRQRKFAQLSMPRRGHHSRQSFGSAHCRSLSRSSPGIRAILFTDKFRTRATSPQSGYANLT